MSQNTAIPFSKEISSTGVIVKNEIYISWRTIHGFPIQKTEHFAQPITKENFRHPKHNNYLVQTYLVSDPIKMQTIYLFVGTVTRLLHELLGLLTPNYVSTPNEEKNTSE